MDNKITPNWRELLDKTEDELREDLIELNRQSLLKLTREMVLALNEYIKYTSYLKEQKDDLYKQLGKIEELAQKR